jgi:hypothetical protein
MLERLRGFRSGCGSGGGFLCGRRGGLRFRGDCRLFRRDGVLDFVRRGLVLGMGMLLGHIKGQTIRTNRHFVNWNAIRRGSQRAFKGACRLFLARGLWYVSGRSKWSR